MELPLYRLNYVTDQRARLEIKIQNNCRDVAVVVEACHC